MAHRYVKDAPSVFDGLPEGRAPGAAAAHVEADADHL